MDYLTADLVISREQRVRVSTDGLYRSGSDALMLFLADCATEGKEIDKDSYNSMELSEEEVDGSDKGG